MKTLEDKAFELYPDVSFKKDVESEDTFRTNEIRLLERAAFIKGYEEAMRWRNVKMELPEIHDNNSTVENEDLVIIKLPKYNSYEFAVLVKVDGKLVWDLPDVGTFELHEIVEWRPIE